MHKKSIETASQYALQILDLYHNQKRAKSLIAKDLNISPRIVKKVLTNKDSYLIPKDALLQATSFDDLKDYRKTVHDIRKECARQGIEKPKWMWRRSDHLKHKVRLLVDAGLSVQEICELLNKKDSHANIERLKREYLKELKDTRKENPEVSNPKKLLKRMEAIQTALIKLFPKTIFDSESEGTEVATSSSSSSSASS